MCACCTQGRRKSGREVHARIYADQVTSPELARIKGAPTDTELSTQIDEVESKVSP